MGSAALRRLLRGLGPPPAEGPWAAPAPLVAGSAGDRPAGVAGGATGHGRRGGFEPRDRARDPAAPLSTAGRSLQDRFVTAIDDDLDMPVALALLREILRTELPADERRWLVLDADFVLGLDLHRVWETAQGDERDGVPQEVSRLVGERSAARGSRAQRRPGG